MPVERKALPPKPLQPGRILLVLAAVVMGMAAGARAQTTSVVEWNFTSATTPLNASVINTAVQTAPVVMQANGGITLSRNSTGTIYEVAGTTWAGTEDTAYVGTRTSLVPRAAKSLSANFTLTPLANGVWTDLTMSFRYQRPTTAPSRARAVITWQEGSVVKRCYTASMTLTGTAWSTATAKFASGDALPTNLSSLPCLVELYFWGNSTTPNGIYLDDVKLLCSSLANAYTMAPSTLIDWPVSRAYSAQLTIPGYVGAITWSSTGSLPAGLTLNTTTGEISGTPTIIGSSTFTVSASGTGLSATKSYTLGIVAAPAPLPAGNSLAKLTFDGDTTQVFATPLAGDVSACYSEVSFGYDAGTSPLGSSLHAGGSTAGSGNPINPGAGGKMRCLDGWAVSNLYSTARDGLLHFNTASGAALRFGVYPAANTASIPVASQTTTGENAAFQIRVKLDPNTSGDLKALYFDAMRWTKDMMDVSGINGPRWAELHAYWTDDVGALQRWDSGSIDIKAVYLPEHRGVNQFGRYWVDLDVGATGLNQRIKSTTTKYRARTVFFDLYLWHDTGADLSGMAGANPPVILFDEMGVLGDFVCTPPLTGIGNTVFNDTNYNGRFDAGEGIASVKVELLNASNAVLQSTTTTTGGNYLFSGLSEGSYKVRVPASEFASGKPLYQMISVAGAGGDNGVDDGTDENGIDDAAPATNGISSGVIVLAMDSEPTTTEIGNNAGADSADDDNTDLTVDLGFISTPTFGAGDRVFKDVNGNGLYDPGEGVNGATMQLLNSSNTILSSVTTANDGRYFFSGLNAAQTYYVRVAPANFGAGGALQGWLSVIGNGTDDGVDHDDNGLDDVASATNGIKSTLITPDANRGGIFSYTWPPSAGATMSNEGGSWYQVTARNNYITKVLEVSVTLDTATQNTQALWMVLDNGVAPASADTNYAAFYLANGVVTVTPYAANPTTTHPLGTIITTTPYTVTNSGTKRTFKFSLNTTLVNQWAGKPPGWVGTGFPYDAQGLQPDLLNKKIGLWIRSFADGAATLAGSNWTVTWGATGDTNIGVYDDVSPLTEIGCDKTIDFGFRLSNDFGDFSGFASASSVVSPQLRLGASSDAELTSIPDALATGDDTTGVDDEDGVTVPATIASGASVTIPVTVLNNTGAVAYLNAWIDFNNDGVLTDTLVGSGGEKLMVQQTVTSIGAAQNVNFTFTVPASAVAGGGRGLRVRVTSLSNPGPTGASGNGEVEDYVVAITSPTLTLGDLIWNDVNNNGIKDATELGLGGATVQLFQPGTDNLANTADDTQVGVNQVSSVTGAYVFSGLSVGKYFVRVTPAPGYPVSSGTPATTDDNVNGNNDGSQPGGAGTALFSPVVDLAVGAEPVNDGDTNANTNMSVDFGLFSGFNVGDLVFNDANNNGILDSGELGISGVTVELLNGTTGAQLATTTTNGTGQYGFVVYTPGSYKVRVTPPAAYPLVSSTVGTDNGTDATNDGTQPGGSGTVVTSFAFTLTAAGEPGTTGTTNTEGTIDIGLRPPTTDFGDWPSFAAASQFASPDVRIGTNATDTEAASPTTANADDTTGVDDEDLVLPSVAIGGVTTFKFPVTLSGTATAATISALADWNGDNDTLDTNETLVVTPSSLGVGTTTVTVTFSPPAGTTAGTKYVRLRIAEGVTAPAFSGTSTARGEVEDYAVTVAVPTLDFGDYIQFADASSTVLSTLKIGSLADAELASNKNGAATGDDVNNTDDEDGVVFSTFTPGAAATITVTCTNTSGAAANLNAWIDWNENGVLTDAGEQVATNVSVANASTNVAKVINVNVPATARGTIPVRVRLTSTPSPTSVGQSGNGEVEDHLVSIASNCQSQLAIYDAIILNNLNTPADIEGRTVVKNITGTNSFTAGLMLAAPTNEIDLAVQTNVVAGGAINLQSGSLYAPSSAVLNGRIINYNGGGSLVTSPAFDFATVFNGVTSESATYASMPTNSTVTIPTAPGQAVLLVGSGVANGTPAVFSVAGSSLFDNSNVQSIDLNLNGKTPSAIIINVTGTTISYAASGNGTGTYAGTTWRSKILWNFPQATTLNFQKNLFGCTLAPLATLTATGGAMEGAIAVKDYNGTIEVHLPLWTGGASVCTDAADYGDFITYADASSTAVTTIRMGTNAGDVDAAGLANSTANGDDQSGTDDEDGVTFSSMPQAGTGTITVNVSNSSGAAGYLNGWIDWNNNGVLTDAGEQVVANVSVATGTNASNQAYAISVPVAAAIGQHGARFRFTSTSSPGPAGYSGNGEVEDFLMTVSGPNTDFGDFAGFAGASSIANSTLKLGGNAADGEAAATTNATATGDDTTGQDDEDGVTLSPSMNQGGNYTITVNRNNTSGATAYLNGWIDWNNNGVLTDAGEQIISNVSIANNAAGNQNFAISVPANATVGSVGARFRITSTSSPGSTGASGNGEVEDYVVAVAAATGCYAVDGTTTIYRFDVTTGAYGSVTTAPFNLQAVTFDAVRNRVYYVEKAAANWRVGYYDVAANTHTTLSSNLAAVAMGSPLTAQPETLLFWANSLFIVDPNTTDSYLLIVAISDTALISVAQSARIDQDGDHLIGSPTGATIDSNGILYISTSTEFSKFDLKVLDGYQVISTTNGLGFNALGFNGGTLYGVKTEATPKVYAINTTTGAATAGATVGAAKAFTDMGCPATQLPLQCREGDVVHTLANCPTLLKVNLITGHQNQLTETCPFNARSCAYDPVQHAIFYTEQSSASPQRLAKFDLTTFTHTILGDLMAASFTTKPTAQLEAITWFNGKLYYINNNTDDLIAITTVGSTISSQVKVADIAANARHFGTVGALAVDGAGNLFIASTGTSFFGKFNIGSLSGYTQLSTSNVSTESLAFNPVNGLLYGASTTSPTAIMGVNSSTGALANPADGFPARQTGQLIGLQDMAPMTCTMADHGDYAGFADARNTVSTGLKMGTGVVDGEFIATTNGTATGDDTTGTDDEDGVTLPVLPQASTQTVTINLTNASGAVAYLNGWIDWNNNGVLTDAGEQVFTNIAVANGVSAQNQPLSVSVPATATIGTVGARFRISSASSPGSTGTGSAGEVEDYLATVVGPVTDYGDAPATYGVASHVSSATVGIGLVVDNEIAQTSNATATGDDVGGSTNDEEGVFADLPLVPGREAALIVSTRGDGFLNAWMDFNRDGDFNDVGEQLVSNQAITASTAMTPNQAPPAFVPFTVPATAVAGTSYIRVRMSSASLSVPSSVGGIGEVEDLAVTILSPASITGRAWADVNGDGIRTGAAETGVQGMIAILYRNGGKVEATTVTNATGDYGFSALPSGSYYVKLMMPSGYSLSPELQGADTTLDSDFVVASGQTAIFALAAGGTKANLDAGLQGTTGRVTVSAVKAPSLTNWTTNFAVGKFDPALGTLLGVEVRSVANYTHDILIESFASGGGTANVTWTRSINLNLPNSTVLGINNSNVSNYTYATFDGQMDYRGPSGLRDFDSTRTLASAVSVYPTTGHFVGTAAGQTLTLAGSADVSVVGNLVGGNSSAVYRSRVGQIVTVTYSYGNGVAGDFGDWNGSGALTTTTSSTVNTNLRLGATVDLEASVSPDAAATADGVDDDGVNMPSTISPGASVTIPVRVFNNNTTGSYLQAWIDFNNDGTFTNSDVTSGGERIYNAATPADAAQQTIYATFTVPSTASLGTQRGVRFRISDNSATTPTSSGATGEIEDYVVDIAQCPPSLIEYDFNSGTYLVPVDPSFLSPSITGGAFQMYSLTGLPMVTDDPPEVNGPTKGGFGVDSSPVGDVLKATLRCAQGFDGALNTAMQTRPRANLNAIVSKTWSQFTVASDVGTGSITGVTFDIARQGPEAPSTVQGYLTWFDGATYRTAWTAPFTLASVYFNPANDGTKITTGHAAWQSVNLGAFTAGGDVMPVGAGLAGKTFLFELYIYGDSGAATDTVELDNLALNGTCVGRAQDFGDWNGIGALTTTTSSAVNSNLRLGATVDSETSVSPDAAATADGADENGVTMPTSIAQSASVTIPVSVFNNTGANAYLNAWIDFNNDGAFDDTLVSSGGERLLAARTIASSASASAQSITFTVPAGASPGASRGVRFRLTDQATTLPTGAAGTGEVEDYVVTINAGGFTVGNLVFADNNQNSKFDSGDAGVSGVSVQLWTPGPDGIPLNADDVQFGSAVTTNASGLYYFNGITSAGDFYVKIPASEFGSGKPLFGKESSVGWSLDNGDDNISENGVDGYRPQVTGITSGVFRIDMGGGPTETGTNGTYDDLLSGDANGNLTIDFGFIPKCTSYSMLVGEYLPANMVMEFPFTGSAGSPAACGQINGMGGEGMVVDRLTGKMYFATAGNGVQIYDIVTGTQQTFFGSSGIFIQNVAFSPDHKYLYAVEGWLIHRIPLNGTVPNIADKAFNLPTAQPKTPNSYMWGMDVDVMTGDIYVTRGFGAPSDYGVGSVYRLPPDLSSATEIPSTISTSQSFYTGLAFMPDGTFWVASAALPASSGVVDSLVHFKKDGTLITTVPINLAGFGTSSAYLPYGLSLGPDGKLYFAVFNPNGMPGGATVFCVASFDPTTNAFGDYLRGPTGSSSKGLGFSCMSVTCNGFDFGDWNGSGAATATTTSTVDSDLRMGAAVDAENNVTPDAAATADGVDEDGVTMPASMTQGASVTIPVSVFNNTGSTAYLNAWIDFNNDGTFSDTLVSSGGERLVAARSIASSATSSTQNITFTVPAGASPGTQRGARFRLTSLSVTGPTGAVGSGEVEDYVVTITAASLSVGNLVWNDANNNGNKDLSETALGGATVELLDGTGTSLQSTTSSVAGAYAFTGLLPGSYRVRVTPPSGFALASSSAGSDNGTDNNNDGSQPGGAGTPSTSFLFNLGVISEPGTTGTTNVENTIDFGFRPCPTITMSPTTLGSVYVGSNYSVNMVASGGSPSYTFSITSGSLPPGLSLNPSSGVINGKPTAVGTYPFTLRVADSKGCVGLASLSLATAAPPTLDFGDCSALGLAQATVVSGLRIGALVDAEFVPTLDTFASGDDFADTDDEDGVMWPPTIVGGVPTTATVTVTNSTGAPAYLNAWIDFNRNGVLTDAGEQIAMNVAVPTGSADLVRTLNFTPPAGTTDGRNSFRVTLTTTTLTAPTGVLGSGEIEDYMLQTCPAVGYAYGPGLNTGTLFQVDVATGAVQIATPLPAGFESANGTAFADNLGTTGCVIIAAGTATDQRLAVWDRATGVINLAGTLNTFGFPTTSMINSGDYWRGFYWFIDEYTDDLWKATIAGSSGSYTITSATKVSDIFNNSHGHDYGDFVITPGGMMYGMGRNWTSKAIEFYRVDLNQAIPTATVLGNPAILHNGITLGLNGRLYGGLGATANNADWFEIDLANGNSTYLNAGFTNGLTDMTMGTCLPAPSITPPAGADYGDYALFAPAGATMASGLRLGASEDADTSVTININATGDDTAGSDDEDGVTAPASIQAGSSGTVTINVTNASGAPAYLNGWADLNGDGSLAAGEKFIANVLVANGTNNANQTYTLSVPVGSYVGTIGLRFRLSSVSGVAPTGVSGNGEVEDYVLSVLCPTITLSPASLPLAYLSTPYSTTLSASGGVAPYTWAMTAGSLPTGITLDSATGVISGTPPATPSSTPITFQVTDAMGCQVQTSGFTFIVTGLKIGNKVWHDANCNGLADTGETGISGIVMSAYTRGPNNVAYDSDDVLVKSATTAADGTYQIADLVPGTYYVRFTPPSATYPMVTLNGVALDNGIDNDSNAQQPGGGGTVVRSPVLTLTPGGEPTTDDGDNNTDMTIDFGMRPGFRIGDLVWKDVNDNGVYDTSEVGLSGVTVSLMSPGSDGIIGGVGDVVLMTTTTNAAGSYFFTLPVAGNFFIRVTPPTGFDVPSALAGSTDNGVDNDNNGVQPGGPATFVYSHIFNLAQCMEPGSTGTTNNELTIDVGLVPNSLGIGNLVFRDDNANGHADPGEGLNGVTVQLYRQGQTAGVSTPIATTTTAGGGLYKFADLPRSSYFIHIPASMFASTGIMKGMFSVTGAQTGAEDDDLGEDGIDSQTPDTTGISTRLIALAANAEPIDSGTETGFSRTDDNLLTGGDDDNDYTIDLGFYRWVGVGNLVFFDANGDGKASASEGVNGVTVQLYWNTQTPGVDTPVATTVTAGGGKYLFTKQKPGIYLLHIPALMFAPGQPLAGKMSIAQGAFGDDDVGEDGLNGPDPQTDGVTTSDQFIVAGVAPTSQNGESGVDNASDDTLDAAIDLTVDFGFQDPVAVGNLVFYDANGNGHFDVGEGVDNVLVQLFVQGSVPGGALPVAAVTTSGGGHYKFSNLPGGSYFVHLPASNFETGRPLNGRISISGMGALSTDDDVGEDGLDSGTPITTGISSADFTLTAGSMPVNSGTETGYLGSEDDSNLQDANGNMTIDLGFTLPDPNKVGVGNAVYNDVNGNGVFDSGEGIDGVTLRLYSSSTTNPDDTNFVASTQTSSGGCYYFGNLSPGSYFVQVSPGNWFSFFGFFNGKLVGKIPLPGQGGDNGLDDDSDENGDDPANPGITGVRSTVFTLAPGTEPTDFDTELGKNTYIDASNDENSDLSIDFGFYTPVGVGNMVFVDLNGNGKADSGEGVGGVTVELFVAGDDAAFSTPVATTTTSTASTTRGKFLFTGLRPRSYFLHIPATMFTAGGPLMGKVSMTGVEASEGDDYTGENGIDPGDITSQGVSTDFFALNPGTEPTGNAENGLFSTDDSSASLGDTNYDLTQDFGFVSNVCVGNLVFMDVNRDGKFTSGVDSGIDRVTVQLWSQPQTGTATLAATTTTAGGGRYEFCVPPGSYQVRIPSTMFQTGAVLANTQATTPGVMSSGTTTVTWQDDTVGQDASDGGNPLTNGAATATFALTVGAMPVATSGETGTDSTSDDLIDTEENLTIDLGFKPLPLVAGNLIFKDVNANGKFDAGDSGVSGVTVRLFQLGDNPLTATATATAVTATNGTFTVSAYSEGQYFLHVSKAMFAAGGPLVGLNSSPGFSAGTGDDNVDENGIDAATPTTTGVSSSIFSLGYGALPVDAASEKGAQATADNSADANGDLTIDFGFRVPPPGTPLAGRVRRDLNGDGAATTADAPLSGVEVAVYADTNQNGRIDPEEMSAAATTVSKPDGSYVIEGLPANAYVVEAIPLPGATAVADTDGGKPDQTAVVVGSAPLASVDFLQSLSPDTFSQWQSQNGLGGENGAGDNPDADGFDNLVEYALGSDPSSGVQATARFHLEATAGIDAVLMRPAQGRNDVRYALEGSTDTKLWTRLGTTSTATITGDDEVLRFAGLASDAVFTGKAMGYVRLRVDVDADHNGTAEATGYSPVHAFGLPVFGAAQTTFSMPLVRDEIYAGTVGTVTGQSLAISKGSGLKELLAKAGECYVEIVSGAFAGQRFDLNEASTTDAQLSIDLSNARNTSTTLPAAITGERVVVRPHWTLGALLPAASFHAATSASAADRVLFFENGGYSVHWLVAMRDGTRWVRTGDAKLEDAGVTRIIAGAEGMFVQSRTGSITVPVVGVVPVVRLVQRAATSSIMTGSGTARAIAISEMAGAKTGDKLRMWLGDSVPGAMSFSGVTMGIDGWTQDTDGAAAGSVQLPPFRAVFFTPVSATAVSGAP